MEGTTGLSCVSSRQLGRQASFGSPQLRQARIADLDVGVDVSDESADAEIAFPRQIDTTRKRGAHAGDAIAGENLIVNETRGAIIGDRGGRRAEEWSASDRLVQFSGRRGFRAERAIHTQLGTGTDQAVGEVTSGGRDLKVRRCGVLQIQSQHQERRRVRFGPGRNHDAALSGVVLHHSPGDGFVTVKSGQQTEVFLQCRIIERVANVAGQ